MGSKGFGFRVVQRHNKLFKNPHYHSCERHVWVLDPDYFRTQRLTKKSDVYTIGVVMLEVLCGRPVVYTSLEEDQISLVFWARHCIEIGRLSQIIDTSMRGQISPNALKCFVEIAYKCLHDRPQERPTMAEVVAGLEFALASQHGAIIAG
ncbi:unnamed protein product [Camellia sinensis]